MTTYDVFMHFYNDDIGKAVTNETECKWYPCLTTPLQYGKSNSSNKYLQPSDMNQLKLSKDQESLEVLYISPSAATTASDNTKAYEDYIVKNATISNPKYDMIFIWDGMGTYNSTHTGADDKTVQLYFDKTKRVSFKPWFFHSTYHSLRAAIAKAEQLVDLFGKDHIMIGKEVSLDQYIDIV
jgi:hypothetical protein